MNIGKLIILGGLVYIVFFNDRAVELSVEKSNKQIASIGFNPNPNAIENRKSVCGITGFFLDPSQESVFINVEKNYVTHGKISYRFKIIKQGADYILVDYGADYERDYYKLENNGNVAVIPENNRKNVTILERINKK